LLTLRSNPHLPTSASIVSAATPTERRVPAAAAAAEPSPGTAGYGASHEKTQPRLPIPWQHCICQHCSRLACGRCHGRGGQSKHPPHITHNEERVTVCISWHAKGSYFQHCTHCVTHSPLSEPGLTAFHAWCDVAYPLLLSLCPPWSYALAVSKVEWRV
jgi:hypothetical protein